MHSAPGGIAPLPEYSEVIETNGIKVPFVPEIITPPIEGPLRKHRYEGGELRNLRAVLKPGDRVLELGAGVGLLAASAAAARVVFVEQANPALIPMIHETLRLNEARNVDVRNGVVTTDEAGSHPFYIRGDFWASSMEPDSRPYETELQIQSISFARLLEETRPTVLSCDVEGGELGLFDDADLSSLRHIVIELHPKVYGQGGVRSIVDVLASKGFRFVPGSRPESTVKAFERIETDTPRPGGTIMPVRSFRRWPVPDPKIAIVTCMKNEGPFILEWVAWHRAAGVTDIVVMTNDCSDGTDRLLDRLDDLGLVRHLPNPSAIMQQPNHFQPNAHRYMHFLKEFHEADFVISMDVDEFINVRVGDGTLAALFEAVGDFDVLAMSELNHGSNFQESYQRGFLRDLFPAHQTEAPKVRKAHRGVKCITRMSSRVRAVRNHRPDLQSALGEVIWLDGSGQRIKDFMEDHKINGVGASGRYDLVSLDHFALRSLDSYVVKMDRGDVVAKKREMARRYWRLRDHNDFRTSTFERLDPAARAVYDDLMTDPELCARHDACCDAHEARIEAIRHLPGFAERREWVKTEFWGARAPQTDADGDAGDDPVPATDASEI